MNMTASQIPVAIPLLVVLLLATLFDWRERKIPNVLTFGSSVFAFALHGSLGGLTSLLLAVAGWIACLACFLPFYVRGGMAAGDVKLMAAVGAFIGPLAGFFACLFSLIAGGLIALTSIGCIWISSRLRASSRSRRFDPRAAMRTRIPYAGAIASGTSFVVLVPSVVPVALLEFGV